MICRYCQTKDGPWGAFPDDDTCRACLGDEYDPHPVSLVWMKRFAGPEGWATGEELASGFLAREKSEAKVNKHSPFGKCRDCGQEVVFTKSARGKWLLLDATPSPDGLYWYIADEHGVMQGRKQQSADERWPDREYVTCHYDTCPVKAGR